jgi:hypothetical protein
LVSYKKYVASRVFKTRFQVVDNPSAAAHAAAGDDDGWAGDMQQLLVVLVFLPLEIKGVVAFGLELLVIIYFISIICFLSDWFQPPLPLTGGD